MKKKMPSEGLRLGRDSGSILCDTLKKWRFRTGWGIGRLFLQLSDDVNSILGYPTNVLIPYRKRLR